MVYFNYKRETIGVLLARLSPKNGRKEKYMKCPNCNNELFEGTKVCPFCSAAVEQSETNDTMPFNQPPVNNQAQETYYQPPVDSPMQGQYYQPPVQPQGNPQNNSQNNYYQPGFNQPPVNPADPYAQQYQQPDPIADANANSAKTLGIVAVVFGFIIPLVAWICGGIGLSKATKVLYINPFHQKAKSAKTFCIVGIIIGVVVWIINMIVSQYLFDEIFDSLMY